ncbi:MAG: MTH1187 family thiamine-binding protein [Bacteroidales bacterium]|nr:MTH1187 family thiamine-binding protein [Bacteroidales bacterium]
MSVLVNFAMFPTDSGTSVSKYVSEIIEMIAESGFSYKLNPMGTSYETETMSDALDLIEKSYKILENHDRIYAVVNFDIQKNKSGRMISKIKSIEEKIGKVKT